MVLVMVVNQESSQERAELNGVLARFIQEGGSIGDEPWWAHVQSIGMPYVIEINGEYAKVLFLWRGPEPSVAANQAIYVDINGVTDHHSFSMAKFTHIDNTDVWFYIDSVKPSWRGGYSFIPVPEALMQPSYQGSYDAMRYQHRQWLRSIFPLSCADPLAQNDLSKCEWGRAKTPCHMPKALTQTEWLGFDSAQGQCFKSADSTFTWRSTLLGTSREIWLYSTAQRPTSEPLPLVLMLDGRFWSQSMPVYEALSQATHSGKLPAALYVLIDEISAQQRSDDLSCNPLFWQAVMEELLPSINERVRVTRDADQTVIVGQSLGGLAAMYAALHWPQRFGSVVCQSGSFWWPDFSIVKPPSEYCPPKSDSRLSKMSQEVHQGLGANSRLALFLEVGSGEDIMIDLSRDLYQQLASQQHRIQFRLFDGGHDRLCWRGGIIDGLSYVLEPYL
ncbi:vanchrobactin esterase VabH [Vibrio anguillarum]|uniref:vanchrobactin esterase VabH n=1 Tax=Vibrio anguillarum TaxID=55601 RepID=UPI0016954526|nr:vanchrobactin esterase VabH [Vibrio anguillarum]MCC4237197.1 vanchrobactin esterase VabH [Vibrio anguillarum]MDT3846826.1 vanchrobactin esterase VabH [Vibrio anguillarum]NOI06777.1 enterochelin esterase [Vibrio anguillarum]